MPAPLPNPTATIQQFKLLFDFAVACGRTVVRRHLDWVAMPFTMAGVFLMGSMSIWGWAAASVGSLIWIVFSIYTRQWPLLIVNVAMILLEIRGFILWLS